MVLADSLNNEESFRGDVSGAVKGVSVFHREVETPFGVFSYRSRYCLLASNICEALRLTLVHPGVGSCRVPNSLAGSRGVALALQGYLAHKKPPPPKDHHRALGIGLL